MFMYGFGKGEKMTATSSYINGNPELRIPSSSEIQKLDSEPTSQKRSKSDKIQYRRMSIALPEKIAELLEELAAFQDITQAEALRRAILSESFLQKELLDGSDILIRKRDGSLERVLFR
jgi:hypothetical protein